MFIAILWSIAILCIVVQLCIVGHCVNCITICVTVIRSNKKTLYINCKYQELIYIDYACVELTPTKIFVARM